jgi:DNA modification methylase
MFAKSGKYYFEQQFENAFDWGTRDRTNMRNGTTDPKLKHLGLSDCNFAGTGRNKRCVWSIPTESAFIKGVHYAAYPEDLCRTPILAGCPKDGTVLDPFAGTGTTLAVAKQLGYKSIGIELSEKYCEVIKRRLQTITEPMRI